ncbi:MAG: protein kinase [Gemmatimonadetes bacterium]|nr:protein kinase [Gemmatimonadota bacterium]
MRESADVDFIAVQEALAGEYSLERELGRGGMGIVYLAREARLARPVAIKVLPPALAARADLREAFLRESQTVAQLSHPNIVPVYTAGERRGFVYIVMAYVDGITLGERVRTRGPLLPGQAARMLREVAWALAYAHSAGIVHRDVSAENIVLERGTDRAIVMDFGIATAMMTAALTEDGRVMGNAHYISPPLDARSDLYSLGVCGFLALTGRLPFDAATPEEIVAQHLTTPAPSVARVSRSVPARLAAAIDRCLAKDPAQRYRSAEAFAEAIDLAFEHAKEIPMPLGVWISQGEKETGPRAMLVTWGLVAGSLGSVVVHNPWFVPLGVATTAAISGVPIVTRLRRVLKQGFTVDDLHDALRERELVRTEELRYERQFSSVPLSPALRVILLVSSSSWVAQSYIAQHASASGLSQQFLSFALVLSAGFAVISTMGLAGQFALQRMASPLAEAKIRFWKSPWGARLASLAGIGLPPANRRALVGRMLTETALGRATDHLYDALPKAVRKELAALPDTVRRLERNATTLRASIDSCDEHLAVFERSGRRDAAVEAELREARDLAADRLAQTIAALESIRLDLLRLQMGRVGVESVTASLAAAQRVSTQIAFVAEAQDEVERLLRPDDRAVIPSEGEGSALTPLAQDVAEDDDADTPIDGVPATTG